MLKTGIKTHYLIPIVPHSQNNINTALYSLARSLVYVIALGNFSTYFTAYKEVNVYHFTIPGIKSFTIYGQLSLSTLYLNCISLGLHAIAALCKQGRAKKKIYSHINYLNVWLIQVNFNT